MSRPTLEVSCLSCRKHKRAVFSTDEMVCKFRDGVFTIWSHDKPCEEWLPSKPDVRIAIQRHQDSSKG